MTPAGSLAAIKAAREQLAAVEREARHVHAIDWIDRARAALPAPSGAVEVCPDPAALESGHSRLMERVVTELLSETPAGGVRLRVSRQAATLDLRDLAPWAAAPVARVEQVTHAGTSSEARRWRERFAGVRS